MRGVTVVLSLSILGSSLLGGEFGQNSPLICGTEEEYIQPVVGPYDTIHALLIYAEFPDDTIESNFPWAHGQLPSWWRILADSTCDSSLSRYFIDNSHSKHILTGDPMVYVTDCDTIHFIAPHDASYYFPHPNSPITNIGYANHDILSIVDSFVDFSLYDRNQDGIVDMVFMMWAHIEPWGGILGYRFSINQL